jgi:hypothetical protein
MLFKSLFGQAELTDLLPKRVDSMHLFVPGDLEKRVLGNLLAEVLEGTMPGRVGRHFGKLKTVMFLHL